MAYDANHSVLPVAAIPLNQVVDILPGYPFRGSIQLRPDGDALAIQVRHVSSREWLTIEEDARHVGSETLDRVCLAGRRRPDYLRAGDVLFLARGVKNHAILVEQIPEATVCTPHFFLIRVKPAWHERVSPGFLAWQLNHGDGRAAIAVGRQGSLLPSVRKTELADIALRLPPRSVQDRLVALHRAASREAEAFEALMDNRRREVTAIGRALLDATNNGNRKQRRTT